MNEENRVFNLSKAQEGDRQLDFHVIIPARYHSTRLPAKPLAMIGNKPMIVHVCDRARESGAKSIVVATDHEAIVSAVSNAGFEAVMTDVNHPSGSDRVYQAAELARLTSDAILVNVQGDEPFIPAQNIRQVALLLQQRQADMATLCTSISNAHEVLDANVVKVIFDVNNKAIYFSRAIIPYDRDQPLTVNAQMHRNYFRHIGIYAYRMSFLHQFIQWQPSALELSEKLEQLRVLENGGAIFVAPAKEVPQPGVDTEIDLKSAIEYWQAIQQY